MDVPNKGEIYYDGKNIFKYKEKKQQWYRNLQIGILFQHYNLIEDETALYNIMLPRLMRGQSTRSSEQYVEELMSKVGLTKELLKKKVYKLSGGEKQRVALLRAIINTPRILFCDEPTGALDTSNSEGLMEILKKLSSRMLVIVVSHNKELATKYADQSIEISNGKIINHKIYNKNDLHLPIKKEKFRYSSKWVNHISTSNFKRRFKRNIFSFVGLSLGLISSLLVFGFNYGSGEAIYQEGKKRFDIGSATISKEISKKIDGSVLSLTKMSRPSKAELNNLSEILQNYYYEPNFDAILPQNPDIFCDNVQLSNVSYTPVYTFEDQAVNNSLLIEGRKVTNENLEVIVNKKFYETILEQLNESPLNKNLEISYESITRYLPVEEGSDYIEDIYKYEQKVKIVGVVDELNFLSTPTIYYSYSNLCSKLADEVVPNYSSYLGKEVSWYERIMRCSDSDSLSGFSYRLFCKDINDVDNIFGDVDNIPSPFVISSNGVIIANTFSDLFSSISLGLTIFLILVIIGTILIMGIVSISSYTEDKKRSAILSSIGASKDSVISIYVNENLTVGIIAMFLSFLLAPLLSNLGNYLVNKFTGIESVINIPFLSFYGIPFLFPLLIVLAVILTIIISTIIPISFSKKISLKNELQSL